MFQADSVVDYLSVIVFPLGVITIFVATVLLFLADRRLHTLCAMVGFFLLGGSWYGELFWLSRMNHYGEVRFSEPTSEFSAVSAEGDVAYAMATYEQNEILSVLNVIGIVLLAYGLLMMAIIQFKLSRNPDFRRE